jgi:hypothetical protein
MTSRLPTRSIPALLLLVGLAFLLTAAKCQTETVFVDFVKEVCTDGKDNDEDGKADCDDADCASECAVEVTLSAPAFTSVDSLRIGGTHRNATSISVTVSTGGGQGGTVTPTDGNWSYKITGITSNGSHTVTATATSAKGLRDTAVATFEKRD